MTDFIALPLKIGATMATRVELPKPLIAAALTQAHGLRQRNAKSATNDLIRTALEDEAKAIHEAIRTLSDIK